MRKFFKKVILLLPFAIISQANAEDKIRIGIIAPLKGSYTVLGEDAVRGAQTALKEFKNDTTGKQVEFVIEPSNGLDNSAVAAAKRLIDKANVSIIIGPSSSQDGIAIRDYSKTVPEVVFINGISGSPETTRINTSENFFRFNTDNAQWSAGLGHFVFHDKKYKRVAIVAEDYPFNHAQVFGFEREFCPAGGEVASRVWVKSGQNNYDDIIAQLPQDIDAIYLGFNGTNALDFLRRYKASGGKAKPIGSSITADGVLLNASDDAKELLLGMPSASPQVDTWGSSDWQSFISAYRNNFSSNARFEFPSVFATGYYNATTAALTCIAQIPGNVDKEQIAFRDCLSGLTLNAPNGPFSLDENRQAIGNNYVAEIVEQDDGSLIKKLVRIREGVTQTLGLSEEDYAKLGSPNRESAFCQVKNN